jgi:glucose/mannose-6-phosphate isomerase
MRDPFVPSLLSRVDRSDVYSSYAEWPDLAARGYSSDAYKPRGAHRRLAVLGMGGSASAGDIISSWLAARGGPETAVYKGSVPPMDMKGTLAIACSASGGTAETIQMTKAALANGADVVGVSSGGRLREVVEGAGMAHIPVPDAKAPRYMLPFMLFACVGVVNAAFGLSADGEVRDALASLGRVWAGARAEVSPPLNASKALALGLWKRTPKVYGTRVTRGVGVRFCNAVNENAKQNAFFEEAPEALHNDVETWETPHPAFSPLILNCSADDRALAAGLGLFASALRRKVAAVLTAEGERGPPLTELVSLAYRLDMASYYMAVARGVDPLPTRLLTSLRHRLGST